MLYDGYQRLGTGGVWGSARLDCAGWYSEEEVSGRICRWGDCWSVAVNVDSLKFGRSTCGAGGHRGWLASWPRTPGNIWEPKALSARETHLQSGGGPEPSRWRSRWFRAIRPSLGWHSATKLLSCPMLFPVVFVRVLECQHSVKPLERLSWDTCAWHCCRSSPPTTGECTG